jgi:hypothetical protein
LEFHFKKILKIKLTAIKKLLNLKENLSQDSFTAPPEANVIRFYKNFTVVSYGCSKKALQNPENCKKT